MERGVALKGRRWASTVPTWRGTGLARAVLVPGARPHRGPSCGTHTSTACALCVAAATGGLSSKPPGLHQHLALPKRPAWGRRTLATAPTQCVRRVAHASAACNCPAGLCAPCHPAAFGPCTREARPGPQVLISGPGPVNRLGPPSGAPSPRRGPQVTRQPQSTAAQLLLPSSPPDTRMTQGSTGSPAPQPTAGPGGCRRSPTSVGRELGVVP
jgi:hypothetical protein